MRYYNLGKLLIVLLLAGAVSACCGNVDASGLPCYKEMFSDKKEDVQKKEYQLDQRRPPRFNR